MLVNLPHHWDTTPRTPHTAHQDTYTRTPTGHPTHTRVSPLKTSKVTTVVMETVVVCTTIIQKSASTKVGNAIKHVLDNRDSSFSRIKVGGKRAM